MSESYKAVVKNVSMLCAGVAFVAVLGAQTPILRLTATTDNVRGAADSIRIDVLRWSTDAERDQLMSAWNMTNGAGRAGRGGGRGAARAGRGGRGAAAPAPDTTADDGTPLAASASPGRGAGRGRSEAAPAARTPESSLAEALQQAPTVGYLWSSEVAGYALRYAGKLTLPDGRERIILITDRRPGAINDLWTPLGTVSPNSYTFSLIELRVNAKGEGEGKLSLIGKVSPDTAAKIVALENYSELPVMLKNVKRQGAEGR